ncbi:MULTISPECIES: restriction endonuclease subunit S [unclassified Methylophilus]|uniref:restriction endonuclease subunit S n=1 Tax=unclassified Methylophilus TaxID=2630143 RepID=UPI00035D27B8|nr:MULTISPECIES: restriction endonuclease subunit S [unclassified Methylophilus]
MQQYDTQFKKLTDIGTISRGKSKHRPRNAPELYGGLYPFVQTGDVKHANFYITHYTQTYNEKGLAQSKLWQPGTLCITIAANIADTAILKIPACFPDSIIGFLPRENESDVRFVKYCLDTYKNEMQSISLGTTQDNLSQEKLLSLRFRIPSFKHQQKIAGFLTAYDDLIENNQKRIELLEKIVEEIYNEWFVHFRYPGYEKDKINKGLPEGWRIFKLGDLYKTSSGGTPFREVESNYGGDVCWLKTGELKSTFVLDTEEKITQQGLENSSAKVYPKHTVIIAMYCAMPDISILAVESATNQACCAFFPKMDFLHYTYNYMVIKAAQKHLINFAHGAAQQNLSQALIKIFPLLTPRKELIAAFSEKAEPIFLEIEKLMQANIGLQNIRNKLLSRLISGELSIEHLDIRFPPSMLEENS